ncbi:fructosamine kinase [Lentinula edodes]|uniref:fructosamine kinase n=1 Tax=Lentinula edodes TaxID=5353 RepID=UPI001E8CBD41|nr:fructosamine kinase [Lentinula edodes]KAH7880910.1 fructosamine kinase [Lentinula edodes]KAJ3910045.1 fructosamine kinase [Lentinula edodes]
MSLPSIILNELAKIEPSAEFAGRLGGRVQSSSGKVYFVKLGTSDEAEQYIGEADSLRAINTGAPGLAPRVFATGTFENGRPFFISEYKDICNLTEKSAVILAKRLATEMHSYQSQYGFGFEVPTYCGATRMKNGWYDSWEKCYSEMIGDLLEKLKKRGRYEKLCAKGESITKDVIPKLLGPLQIEPVILHGDLWSGNVGVDSATREPVIFDPSSFFGHNEADLAIARIFGGFPASFFAEYHKHLPKTKPESQYELRGHLYELFHYLNHTVIFEGGGYEFNALRKMDILIDAV